MKDLITKLRNRISNSHAILGSAMDFATSKGVAYALGLLGHKISPSTVRNWTQDRFEHNGTNWFGVFMRNVAAISIDSRQAFEQIEMQVLLFFKYVRYLNGWLIVYPNIFDEDRQEELVKGVLAY